MENRNRNLLAALAMLLFTSMATLAQGTAFTYQGQLQNNGSPASGTYNLQFSLYTTNANGVAIAGPVTSGGVLVTDGLFTVTIDFGASPWNGHTNWLQIAVETNNGSSFTTLEPRQQLTPVPYAIYANTASNLLGNISAAQISSGTIGLGLLPAAVVTNGETGVNLAVSNISVGAASQIAPLSIPPNIPSSAVGTLNGLDTPFYFAMSGRYIYVPNNESEFGNSLQIIDVSNPSNPVSVGTLTGLNSPYSVAVSGRYAYVVNNGGNSLQIVDVGNPSSPVSVGKLTGLNAPQSVAVSGHYAYVVNNGGNSLQIVDVSNPANPVSLSTLTGLSNPQSVAIAGRYAYVTASSLIIVDVSNPSNPVVVGSATGLDLPNFVEVSGRYAYVVDQEDDDLVIVDVSNPVNPVTAGTLGGLSSPSSVAVAGRYAYVTSSSGVQIVDVSNPSSPVSVGTLTGLSSPLGVAVSGRYAYVGCLGDGTLRVFNLGGAYIQQLEAGTIETGALQTRDTATVGNDLDVRGGLTVSASARITDGLGADSITAASLQVSGSVSGGFNSPLSLIQNNNTGADASPALRLLGAGNAPNGVLSVSSYGTGLLAEFGNAGAFVADITTNGTVDAAGFNGGTLRVGGTGTIFTNVEAGQSIMPSSSTVETNFTIAFPTAFSSSPKIIFSLANDPNFQGVGDVFTASVSSNSPAAFSINVYRLNGTGWSQQLRVNWQAWQ